jgi:hypothetical protein
MGRRTSQLARNVGKDRLSQAAVQYADPGRGLQKRAEECGFIARVGIAKKPDSVLHAAIGTDGIALIETCGVDRNASL